MEKIRYGDKIKIKINYYYDCFYVDENNQQTEAEW